MPLNNVMVTVSSAPGTGPFPLGAAVAGFQTFTAAGAPDGARISYGARDWSGAWEFGQGTYSASGQTLGRGPLDSSNSGDLVNFGTSSWVWATILVEDVQAVSSNTYYHDIDTSSGLVNFVLPAAIADNEIHVVKDATGGHPGTGGILVTATGGYPIDSTTTFPMSPMYWQDFAQYTFRWSSALVKWLVG